VLLRIAREEAAKGYHRFVVVSADADFAQVADLGTLEIVVRHEQQVSKQLRKRAAKVHRLPRPTTIRAERCRREGHQRQPHWSPHRW
jgi:hypothetical protein